MNTDRLEQLLWERLDGTISSNDLIELEAVLAEHPEPRELESEIKRLAGELDELDTIPPPTELRNRIDLALAKVKMPGDSHHVSCQSRCTAHLAAPMASARGQPRHRVGHRLPGSSRGRNASGRPEGCRCDVFDDSDRRHTRVRN